mgnify:CR=1 FL=1
MPITYDAADYVTAFDRLIERLEYADWRAEQAKRKGTTRPIGIRLCAYVEGTGLGPFRGRRRARRSRRHRLRPSRRLRSGAGPRDDVCPDLRRRPLRARGERGRQGRRHPARRVRHGHHREPRSRRGGPRGGALRRRGRGQGAARGRGDARVRSEGHRARRRARARQGRPRQEPPPRRGGARRRQEPRAREDERPGLHACGFFYPDSVTWAFGVQGVVVEVDVEACSLTLLPPRRHARLRAADQPDDRRGPASRRPRPGHRRRDRRGAALRRARPAPHRDLHGVCPAARRPDAGLPRWATWTSPRRSIRSASRAWGKRGHRARRGHRQCRRGRAGRLRRPGEHGAAHGTADLRDAPRWGRWPSSTKTVSG